MDYIYYLRVLGHKTQQFFSYNVALDTISENEDPESKFAEKCRQRKYWFCGKKQLGQN